ncbi:MAG: DUF72 domain-containing protein [Acidobacteria bacterium]|nr:DUF72 domain-containing protein [Acidobacteriota bacterium]
MSTIHIGTSGWSYPSGRGSWNGIFYPARATLKGGTGPKKVDELRYYAEHFDTVEVNSSFYRPPTPAMAASWIARTPPDFEFSLKLYQKFTHPEMFRTASGEETVEVSQRDVDEFRAAIEPIASAGRLGALLIQFPPSFKNTPESREYLAGLMRAFRAYPLAVELRHREWSDAIADTLALLNEFGAAWVQIDEPKFPFSIRQDFLPNVTGFSYMRFHGRNAEQWWRHRASEDRYDYYYSPEELKPFAATADAARRLVKKLYGYMNNHFAAKSVANAAMLKHQLGMPVEGEYPVGFVERYPELRGIVRTAPSDVIRD